LSSTASTQWIIDTMEEWAPARWAMESDNVGLMVGDRSRPVSRVLTALDLTEDVLREAVQGRFDFIITHHPLFTRHIQPINSITTDNALGKKIMTLITHGIGLFSAHTNLDIAPGGVNDLFFDLLGLQNKEALIPPTNPEIPTLGLVGNLPQPSTLVDLAQRVRAVFAVEVCRYAGKAEQMVQKVGFCAGNGTALIRAALEKKCDVYITGDIGYHMGMDATEAGMALIDATHYSSEIPIAEVIANRIRSAAKNYDFELTVQSTRVDGQVFKAT